MKISEGGNKHGHAYNGSETTYCTAYRKVPIAGRLPEALLNQGLRLLGEDALDWLGMGWHMVENERDSRGDYLDVQRRV
jgi:hypothetical protein